MTDCARFDRDRRGRLGAEPGVIVGGPGKIVMVEASRRGEERRQEKPREAVKTPSHRSYRWRFILCSRKRVKRGAVPASALDAWDPISHRGANSPHTLSVEATDRVLASPSPADTAAARRSLKVLEECDQLTSAEADEWRRRIMRAAVRCRGRLDAADATDSSSSSVATIPTVSAVRRRNSQSPVPRASVLRGSTLSRRMRR
jgi:hypothetical protein